jgi:large subunit ribosomal protein L17
MRHRNKVKTLGRKVGPKKALLRGLAINLITHEKIVTTEAKAKTLRPQIEKMITKARVPKELTLSARRELLSALDNRIAVSKLLEDIGPRFAKRPGGYTRIIKLPIRKGDGAKMAQIEFTEEKSVVKKSKETSKDIKGTPKKDVVKTETSK